MTSREGCVLLTGANGFVASHIVAGLVERNYHIIATVRSEKKAQEIINLHPTWKDYLTFVYISDITVPGAYDEAFKLGNVDYIIHNASPLNFSATDYQKEIIDPAIGGTTELLTCAHKIGGSALKRIVVLGSAVAVLNEFEDPTKAGKPYTEDDWNPVTAEYAIENNNIVAAYNASKTLAEKAAWEFMEQNKPQFDLAVINPDIIIGPLLQYVPGPQSVNESNMFAIYNFINGTYKNIDEVQFPFYHWIDVRDVALAHILAMTKPAASNKRIILVAGLMTPQILANLIRENFPELRDRVIEGHPEQLMPPGADPTGWDTSCSFEILGPDWKYIDLKTSVVDTVKSLLEYEKKWESK